MSEPESEVENLRFRVGRLEQEAEGAGGLGTAIMILSFAVAFGVAVLSIAASMLHWALAEWGIVT